MTSTIAYDRLTAYQPRGAAREIFLCRDPELLIDGPAGTGKSLALLNKAFICANKYPGSRILLVRKTRHSMTESVLVTFESKVVPAHHRCLLGASRRVRQSYDFDNDSTIVLGGMDSQHSLAIMSTDYDLICVFEATEMTAGDHEDLLTRLRNGRMPYQQIIVDCNPAGPRHWLIRRAQAGLMKRLISRHEDNPALYDEAAGQFTPFGERYLAILDRLSGSRRLRLKDGKWAAAEGLVYEQFDEDTHIIDPFPLPTEWRRFRSIDFGFTNPFTCQWWAIDPDGRMYLYREVYGIKRIVDDWARGYINPLSAGEKIEATISDHDAEDRATLNKAGIITQPAFKSISQGIAAVQMRLRVAGDGKPRLFIMRGALLDRDKTLEAEKKPCGTLEEFDGYVWPRDRDGRPAHEVPVKENDHAMDALRYAVAYADGIGKAPIDVRVVATGSKADEWPDEDRHRW